MTNKLCPVRQQGVRRRGGASAASLLALSACCSVAVRAQVVPPNADISRQRVAPLPLPDPRFDLQILNPEKAAVPRAVDEIQFSIARIKVTGSTVMTAEQLAAIFAPLEGKRIVLEDLRRAGERLEALYRSRGYFLTRVFVPPQAVENSTLEVRVVEGFIETVTATAPNKGSRVLAETIVGPVTKKRPVRLIELEAPLLLLNDMPGVRATSLIRAGQQPASSSLGVQVERRATQSYVSVSNFSSEAIGPLTMTAGTSISQPFGTPGLLDLLVSVAGEQARELQVVNARYAAPLGRKGIVGTIGIVAAHAAPGGAVQALDLRSRTLSTNARIRAPLLRQRAHSVYAEFGLTLNRSRISALDQPIVNDRGTVAEAALSWRQVGWLGGDMSVRVAAAKGLLVFGANDRSAPLPSVAGFAPEFLKLTYLVQRNQPISGPWSAGFVLQGQFARQRLVSGEQMMFGGNLIGRGYDPSELIGDKGVGALGELRFALKAAQVRGKLENVQLYGFGDWAQASVNALPGPAVGPGLGLTGSTTRIASLGAGVRALAFGRIAIDGHVASARRALLPAGRRGERVNLTATVLF